MFFESPVFWAILGVVLVIAEVFTLSFVLVFFGVAALIVSALAAEGTADRLAEQLAWFSLLSVASLVILRRTLSRWFKGSERLGSGREDDTGLLNRRGEVSGRSSTVPAPSRSAGRSGMPLPTPSSPWGTRYA